MSRVGGKEIIKGNWYHIFDLVLCKTKFWLDLFDSRNSFISIFLYREHASE